VHIVDLSVRLALLILTGFAAGKIKAMPAEAQKYLMKLLMNITLPCLIIGSFTTDDVGGDTGQFGAVLLAAAIVLVLSALLGHLVYVLMGRSDEGAAAKVCITFANVTFFGIPVVEALYGGALLMYYNVFGTLVRVTNYSLIVPLLGGTAEKHKINEKRKDVFSPPLVAVIIGLLFYISKLPLPTPVAGAVMSLGSMTSPLGMFIKGLILSGARFSDIRKKPVALVVAALRLLVMPAAALGMMLLLGIGETLVKIVILFVSMPVATLLPTYLMRFRPGRDGELMASVCVCLTSVLCIFTVPIWAVILEKLY
jgi:predicted permease